MTDDLRPFAFEDLPLTGNRRIEPESWGPKYSKPSKTVAPAADRWPSNCASGQKYDYSADKHRAKMRAEFTTQCNADKRNWAAGKLTIDRKGLCGNIVSAYAAAMKAKRERASLPLAA